MKQRHNFTLCVLFIIVAQLFIVQGRAQKTVPLPKKKVGTASTMYYAGGDRDTCLNKKFSLVFWIVQDSSGSRTAQTGQAFIDTLVITLNRTFARICVSFEKCSTLIIPHYPYDEWEFPTTDQVVFESYLIKKVINVYLPVDLLAWPSNEEGGYAHAPSVFGAVQSSLDIVVVKAGKLLTTTLPIPPNSMPGAIHAFGHYFGLPDTYAELGPPANPGPPSLQVISHEYADGSNSAVNGDRFTDTEADCFPAHRETLPYTSPQHCEYREDAKDGKGQYYTPPVDNYMSGWNCRCRFTQQQYNHLARYILANRMYLH